MARALRHYKARSSALANTPVALIGGAGVPAGKVLVGHFSVMVDAGAAGALAVFAGNGVTSTDQIVRRDLLQGDHYDVQVVLLAGEDVKFQANVANAGGVATVHLFGEEVDA